MGLATCVLLAGCNGDGSTTTPSSSTSTNPTTAAVVHVDGDTSEWPASDVIQADEHYLYLRVRPSAQPRTLQSFDGMLRLVLDLDGDTQTGLATSGPTVRDASGNEGMIGAEVEIVFSPSEDGAQGRGVACARLNADGSTAPISNGDVGLMFAPTYADNWYEMRIPREAAALPELRERGKRVVGVFEMLNLNGEAIGATPMFSARLPAMQPDLGVEMGLPTRGFGQVRVMSYNVLFTSPVKNPNGFSALIQAADPDIILFQEWHDGTAEDIENWLAAFAPGPQPWRVIKGEQTGVAIASRYAMTAASVSDAPMSGGSSPLRVIAGTIYSPIGPISAASVHLKCCGFAGSPEDQKRMAEAEAINQRLAAAWDTGSDRARVIAGDLNLVGSRPPLDILRAGLDHDGTSLEVADARVLGDGSTYTWRDWESDFTPGRLDWMMVGDARASIARSFVIDPSRLSDKALAAIGITADDANGSDHLPVVADITANR
ncbi:MAG: endonuclease/exonuclease/phosphatase family protein [Phycisphaeraceae bacterium]|nr:endonuclease/exonuclease/phosphatase family protein [Phycisphaerales bacterium]MCB9860893.1 endonuclease/exonuclease/phosphatase family protein [Phycisphaeraceae bacterium]